MVLNVLCRVCIHIDPVGGGLVNIFEKYNNRETVAGMIYELTGSKVDLDDGLPHFCCMQCQLDLHSSVLIRRKCIESEKKIKSMLESDHTQSTQVYPEQEDYEEDKITSLENYEYGDCHADFVFLDPKSMHASGLSILNKSNTIKKEDEELNPVETKEKSNSEGTNAIGIRSEIQTRGIHNYRCCGCTESFESAVELKEHSSSVHASNPFPAETTKPFQCNICYRWYTTARGVQEHQNDMRKRRYQCTMCGQQFSRPSRLTIHENLHTREMNFPCKHCGEKFHNLYARRVHMTRAHTSKETVPSSKQNVCLHCGKSFRSAWYLKSHLKLHSEETPHQCTVCGAHYKLAVYLKWHMKVHSGLLSCKHCSLSFKSPSDLKEHQNRHTGHKEFRCGSCEKYFYSKKDLKKHQRIHDKKKHVGTIAH